MPTVSDRIINIPISIKAPIVLIGLIALFAVLYIASGIIVPLIFSTIIAIVLHPVVNFFIRLRMNRILAIIIILFITILIIASIGLLLFSQAHRFTEAFPRLVDKFTDIINQAIIWVSGHFNISNRDITEWITKTKNDVLDNLQLGETIVNVGNMLALLFLIPVYVFMMLYYQPLLIEFFRRAFGTRHRSKVSEVINLIKTLIQHYLIGLLLQVAIIATMYSVGLLFLGIDYAIILGIIGAFLNIVPYLGSIIAALMPMLVAIVTKPSPWYAVLVLALYIVTQFIDNNFITPNIVGSKVKLNSLATIIAVIIFGVMWGISGMLLAIPLTAIAKLIFDHIESLKPWGFLLGDTMPSTPIFKPLLKKK